MPIKKPVKTLKSVTNPSEFESNMNPLNALGELNEDYTETAIQPTINKMGEYLGLQKADDEDFTSDEVAAAVLKHFSVDPKGQGRDVKHMAPLMGAMIEMLVDPVNLISGAGAVKGIAKGGKALKKGIEASRSAIGRSGPESFFKAVEEASQRNPRIKEMITRYNPEELNKMDTFLTKDMASGFALKPTEDGGKEIVSLFSGKKGRGDKLINEAVKQGGDTLDAFDGYLTQELYPKAGFKEYAREPNWTPGSPDVVFMKKPEAAIPNEYLDKLKLTDTTDAGLDFERLKQLEMDEAITRNKTEMGPDAYNKALNDIIEPKYPPYVENVDIDPATDLINQKIMDDVLKRRQGVDTPAGMDDITSIIPDGN
jgi:hypothetical protein